LATIQRSLERPLNSVPVAIYTVGSFAIHAGTAHMRVAYDSSSSWLDVSFIPKMSYDERVEYANSGGDHLVEASESSIDNTSRPSFNK
jgi:hypothetical protein